MQTRQYGQQQDVNALAQKRKGDADRWAQMLAMMKYAQNGDAGTMLGFGLGRLLRDGFLSWKQNYQDRGAANEEEFWMKHGQEYEDMLKTNPDMTRRDFRKLKQSQGGNNTQPDGGALGGYNPEPLNRAFANAAGLSPDYYEQPLGVNTDWMNGEPQSDYDKQTAWGKWANIMARL